MDIDAIDLLPRLVSHLALIRLFRRSSDLAVCHDWIKDTADAENGKERIDQCNEEHDSSGLWHLSDTLKCEGVGHRAAKPCNPHDGLVLRGEFLAFGPLLIDEERDNENVDASGDVQIHECE